MKEYVRFGTDDRFPWHSVGAYDDAGNIRLDCGKFGKESSVRESRIRWSFELPMPQPFCRKCARARSRGE